MANGASAGAGQPGDQPAAVGHPRREPDLHRSFESPGQIVVFVIIVALAPAVLLSAAMLAGHSRSGRFGRHFFRGAMAALTFLFVIQVVDVIGGPAWP